MLMNAATLFGSVFISPDILAMTEGTIAAMRSEIIATRIITEPVIARALETFRSLLSLFIFLERSFLKHLSSHSMTGFIRYASTSPIIIGIAAASSLLHIPAKPSNLYSAKKNSILTANVTNTMTPILIRWGHSSRPGCEFCFAPLSAFISMFDFLPAFPVSSIGLNSPYLRL